MRRTVSKRLAKLAAVLATKANYFVHGDDGVKYWHPESWRGIYKRLKKEYKER